MFPKIEFDPLFSEKDKKIITFIVHSVMREYSKVLNPFDFWQHPPSKITVNPSFTMHGVAYFSSNVIELNVPLNLSRDTKTTHSAGTLILQGVGYIVAHELAHHYVDEYFGGSGAKARDYAVNLVHYEHNMKGDVYTYSRRYWTPTFLFRYGVASITIAMLDLKKLITDRDYIMAEIAAGRGRGPSAYR